MDPKKLHVIENGIDLARFQKAASRPEMEARLGLPLDKLWIVIVARLVPHKGHRYLIEAFSVLIQEFPQLGLLIPGEGECEAILKIQVKESGLHESIIFLGLRRDIPDILAFSEIMVLPSSKEGLPIVLLESMAAGCPVVVTPVGGMSEIVEDGINGFIVSQDPTSIAGAIRKLLNDPSLCHKMGKSARALIEEKYDILKVTKRYEDLYEAVISQKTTS